MRGIVLRAVSYRDHSVEPVRRRTVASLAVPVILSFGPSIRVRAGDGGSDAPGRELTSFVAGPDARHGMTEFTGKQDGMQVDLTPFGARMLLGMPMDHLAGQVVDLEDALGAEGRMLVERLVETPDRADRVRLVEALIAARVAEADEPSPAARWAWSRLIRTGGTVPIGTIADELGCSSRYLIAQFRTHVGLLPKTAGRILRFQRALRLLDKGVRLADVAHACGYYDQAHLNRDFREFAGTTPSEFHKTVHAVTPVPDLTSSA